jgi:hypothetical protein
LTVALTLGRTAQAQTEGPVPTQALVNVDTKSTPPTDVSALTVMVNDHKEPLSSWAPVVPGNAQVALLIDDGLRESVGRELDNLRNFVRGLAPGVEVMVGFMQYGHVVAEQAFTTDHAMAASTLHLPEGVPGMSASPYICLSDFVQKWPSGAAGSQHKARFILVITNGVDPYNGSTSVMNQGSPYVDAAIADAQRAGVAVYAIYFADAGLANATNMADNSGQDYLQQLTQGTGGVNFWEGVGNPQSTAPFLKMFQGAIAETYIATFNAPAGKDPRDLVRVKFTAARVKLHAADKVRPGNQE